MNNKKIIIVVSNAEERTRIKRILNNSPFVALDFTDSMGAIQWIMENGNPQLLILEESSSPLNGWQTMDYLRTELKMEHPTLIVIDSDTEITNKKLQGFIRKPFSDKTALEIENFLNTVEVKDKNEELVKSYSTEYLEELSEGSKEFVAETLVLFKESVSGRLNDLKIALEQNNFDEARKIAHSIKPSFQMVLNQHGRDLCQSMETAKTEELNTLFSELNQEYQLIETQITADYQLDIN